MSDALAVCIGIVVGVAASIPISLLIAVSTTPRSTRYLRDLRQPDVTTEPSSREIVVFDAESREVLP